MTSHNLADLESMQIVIKEFRLITKKNREMILNMTSNELDSLVDNISAKELHEIVLKIRAHRVEAQKVQGLPVSSSFVNSSVDVTNYVVQKHIKAQGWDQNYVNK